MSRKPANHSALGTVIAVHKRQLTATNSLAESSQKLEGLTKSINKYTWGLLSLTGVLVVTSIVTIVLIVISDT